MPATVYIDGSQGEGGGQILRTSLALAALLQQPVQLDNIRANRPQPGLKTQHLAGVLALARITDAEVRGAHKHSTSLEFAPRTIRGGKYRFEISTAGAATMLFGAILPALLFAPQPSEIVIIGGTHVPFSPPFHYLDRIFLPALQKLGAEVELKLVRWGFYPKGGGEIRAHISPCGGLQSIQVQKRGALKKLYVSAYSSVYLPEHIVQREIAQVAKGLQQHRNKLSSQAFTFESYSPGNFVFLEAEYENSQAGFSALGKRGKPAEEVADKACRAFIEFDNTVATADMHLADQIILYLALAHGESSFVAEKVTSHLVTNIEIIREFLPVSISMESRNGKVRLPGIGFNI